MIRLQNLSIEKRPKEYDAAGKVKSWQWVVCAGSEVAYCDTEEEAEIFIGTVRLKTAAHNNFDAKRIR